MGGVYNALNLGLYSYTHLNPIKFVDPDGNEISAASTVENRSNGTTKSTIYIKFTGTLSYAGDNSAGKSLSKDLAKRMKSAIESSYSQTFTDTSGNVTEYKMSADIVVGKATAGSKRHNIEILQHGDPILGPGIGFAPGFETTKDLYISDVTFDQTAMAAVPNMSFERTTAHEFGHKASLRHPNDPGNPISGLPASNLMSQTAISGSAKVERSQLRQIFKNKAFR
jgi:hypothetical protein